MHATSKSWICRVCGYVHQGSEAPELCPVCGVSSDEFEAEVAEPTPPAPSAPSQWRCLICDYIHEGSEAPGECPVCGAGADQFEAVEQSTQSPAQNTESRKVIVVGGGVAGVAAIETLRDVSPNSELILISDEAELPYYRLNLTRYLAGEISEDSLPLHSDTWYKERNIRLLLGTSVQSISPETKTIEVSDGSTQNYDKLVLTAGAHAFIPPLSGTEKQGLYSLRTIADARNILEMAKPNTNCLCIGGGILGLETAGALAQQGAKVTLLESHGWLLPRQLNKKAGEVLEHYVEKLGIRLIHGARSKEILGETQASGVALEDGTTIKADLIVITTGIRSNTHLARKAGLEVNKGVVVDDLLSTSNPDILAAGDVAEHRGLLYGTWIASQFQGKIAGMNAAGSDALFGGIPRSNTLKVLGVDLFSIGQVEAEDASYRLIEEESDTQYFRFVFRDTSMVGAVLLGDTKLSAAVTKAIETKESFSAFLRGEPSSGALRDRLSRS